MMAIKCFVNGCGEDVIGQCPGLENEPCGHFYCAVHSKGRLCDECFAMKEQRDLYEKYSARAKWVPNTGARAGLAAVWVVVCLPLGVLFYSMLNDAGNIAVVVLVSWVVLSYALIWAIILKTQKKRYNAACEELPNFADFYKAYKSHKQKEMLKTTGVLALGLLAGTIAYSLSSEASMERDIRRIRNRLDGM